MPFFNTFLQNCRNPQTLSVLILHASRQAWWVYQWPSGDWVEIGSVITVSNITKLSEHNFFAYDCPDREYIKIACFQNRYLLWPSMVTFHVIVLFHITLSFTDFFDIVRSRAIGRGTRQFLAVYRSSSLIVVCIHIWLVNRWLLQLLSSKLVYLGRKVATNVSKSDSRTLLSLALFLTSLLSIIVFESRLFQRVSISDGQRSLSLFSENFFFPMRSLCLKHYRYCQIRNWFEQILRENVFASIYRTDLSSALKTLAYTHEICYRI